MTALSSYTCGLDAAMDVVGGKWKAVILWELQDGPQRFNALHRQLGPVSQKMLTQCLKELQHRGVVHRESYHQVPPRVEYSLTTVGEQLLAVLQPLGEWAEENGQLIERTRAS